MRIYRLDFSEGGEENKKKNAEQRFDRQTLNHHLRIESIDGIVLDRNHKHIHNEEKSLHMDEYHLKYLRNIDWLIEVIYHIHSRDEFPR